MAPDVAELGTDAVYRRLWNGLADERIASGAVSVLEGIFQNNRQQVTEFRNKRILDMGCGSGRFSFAFAKLGAGQVIGIDVCSAGIQRARRLAQSEGLRNLEFMCGNVLELPFEDGAFDFVWCKGVLHHTGDLTRGLDEYFRVMKTAGRGYLYLYGSGGLFWASRRRMRQVMKQIPIDYACRVLELMGMPPERYIFIDSWYVPIEEHVSRKWLEAEFWRREVTWVSRADDRGCDGVGNMGASPEDQLIWGDGDLRYFVGR